MEEKVFCTFQRALRWNAYVTRLRHEFTQER